MARSIPISTAFVLSWLVACAGAPPPATIAGPVELDRYAGHWLELARLPAFFQRGCVLSRAEYEPIPGGLSVVNRCLEADGEVRRADGVARVVPGSHGARLAVRFDGFWARLAPVPDSGNYWILALDPEYRTAVVGTGDRRYLWILAREPVAESAYEALVARARDAGYDVARLVRADWGRPWPAAAEE